MSEKIIFKLGNFSFSSDISIDNLEVSLDTGVSISDRIKNHPVAVFGKSWNEVINISGETIPLSFASKEKKVKSDESDSVIKPSDRNNPLNDLIQAAKSQKEFLLTNSIGKCLGKFVIVNIRETRKNFLPGGGFLSQSFTLSLQRVDYA